MKFWILPILIVSALVACKNRENQTVIFDALDAKQTDLNFENKLTPTESFNLFDYMYYYNGSGVAAGDFNNDGLTDLFFGANQSANKIYLNQGELRFTDVSEKAKIGNDNGWTTGISVVDINNDGLLDIYISRVGNYKSLTGKNQFLICQGIGTDGIPTYRDMAAEFGLDYSGFSTQAAFFDVDMDGDLDMFLLNHSVHENGVYRPREEFLGKPHPVAGARLYRNEGKKFTDVTAISGINSSVIGYGLGIAVADINLDGYPDIYIGNDFHENDYLYINNGKGTFREEITSRIGHTGRFTMGVDIADVNNDGYSEIISMDMLSDDPYILKRSLGEDDYDIFNLKISYGYQHQYTRNNLQFNRGNGHYTELGLYAGLAATDWSWSPLWMDFDNDGLKDLFISNGIPKRMNDIDYINFVSNEEIQRKLQPGNSSQNNLEMIEKFPKIRIPNKFFRNNGSMKFADLTDSIGNSPDTYSNGAVYADFDNDGDLDIVVNNIDEPAVLYRNNTNQLPAVVNDEKSAVNSGNDAGKPSAKYLEFELSGDSANLRAIGAKLLLFAGGSTRLYEKYPLHGFQSSIETPVHIGLENVKPDSLILIWPDNSYQSLPFDKQNQLLKLSYKKGLPVFNYAKLSMTSMPATRSLTDITSQSGLAWLHTENSFAEFNREPLIPHMLSTEGPALAMADMNGDKLDDIFIGAARGTAPALWLQQKNGKFLRSPQTALENDSSFEDVSACWSDLNKDGNPDLVIASGGNEFSGQSEYLRPRVYMNDGRQLTRKQDALDNIYVTASVVTAADFNGDGYPDLFIGGRAVPMEYGKIPQSYLLLNDGSGKFADVTNKDAPGLSKPGFVSSAVWADMDKDGDQDLVLSLEWGGLHIYRNDQGKLSAESVTDQTGWWNFMIPVDVDNDGDLDLVAGNLGLNSRLKASANEPVRMYYFDFDGNGRSEQVLTYYLKHREIPFASIAELSKQMPAIKKKFLYAGDFAKARLDEIFDADKLKAAAHFSANNFSNAVFINNGRMQFEMKPLPWQAQLTSYRDAVAVNANNDQLPDIFLAGNYFDSNTEMGRYDGDIGTMLINKGNGEFAVELLNGPVLKGQARHIAGFRSADSADNVVIVSNNDSARVFRFNSR